MALLLEIEVAERLRISRYTVKALRRSGKLAFLPGRPCRIDERDLDAYIDHLRLTAAAERPAQPAPTRNSPADFEADARARAMKRLMRERVKGAGRK